MTCPKKGAAKKKEKNRYGYKVFNPIIFEGCDLVDLIV